MGHYRVMIYGYGHVGQAAYRHIAQKDALELVSVYDPDEAKAGKDAGELAGCGASGLLVTSDLEAALSVPADVALYYTSQRYDGLGLEQEHMTVNRDEICEILAHDKNVITTIPIYHSQALAPEFFEQIDRTAKEHGVTYVQQGIYPGFYNPYLPVVLSMCSRNVSSVEVYGVENDDKNTAAWAAQLCFGKALDEVDPKVIQDCATFFLEGYGGATVAIADRLGLDYDEYHQDIETIPADVDFDTKNPLFGYVAKGTIGAHRFNMCVRKDGREVVGFHFLAKASRNILKDLDTGFKIVVEGDNTVTARIDGILPTEADGQQYDPFLTSEAPSVNLIPGLVAARPGYLDALDLGVLPF